MRQKDMEGKRGIKKALGEAKEDSSLATFSSLAKTTKTLKVLLEHIINKSALTVNQHLIPGKGGYNE